MRLVILLLTCIPLLANNWMGYVVTDGGFPGRTQSIQYVEGKLKVPVITPSTNATEVFMWLGLDGYGNNTVEQIGVQGFSYGGQVSYRLWYEMYPFNPLIIDNFEIAAGDEMYLWVIGIRGIFILSCDNLRTGQHFDTIQFCPECESASAEWMVENSTLFPLCKFEPVEWTDCFLVMDWWSWDGIMDCQRHDGFSQTPGIEVSGVTNDSFTVFSAP